MLLPADIKGIWILKHWSLKKKERATIKEKCKMRPRLPDLPPTTKKKRKKIIRRRQNNHSVELLHLRWHDVSREGLQRKICSRKIWLSRHQKKERLKKSRLQEEEKEETHTVTHTHRAIDLSANATLMTETDGVKPGSDAVTQWPLCASQYEDEMDGWMDVKGLIMEN